MLKFELPVSHDTNFQAPSKLRRTPEDPSWWEVFSWFVLAILFGAIFILCVAILI